MAVMQECIRCEQRKEDSAFRVDKSRESGFSRYCKACAKEMRPPKREPGWERKTADMKTYMQAWREKNREKLRKYARTPEQERQRYVERMKKLHGPDWCPKKPMTPEQKAESKRKRNQRAEKTKKAQRERDPEAMQKHKARHLLRRKVQLGHIIPWPCEVCGEKAEAHHPSYDRPLLVVWLCPAHHREAHALTK